MTINKLVRNIKSSDEIDKINELVDELNNGVSITVDAELNESSINPVQNAVITAALSEKQDILTAGSGISISDEGVISNTQTNAEWGNISGNLSEQTDLQDILDTKQTISNLVTTISLSSTDTEYPSAKSVYEAIADTEYEITVESDLNGHVVLVGGTQQESGLFIPADTVIHVELDGSGDFTTLADALTYLNGKWSNGSVKIELGEGTFLETVLINLNGYNMNLPHIIIKGQGINQTIISYASSMGIAVAPLWIRFLNVHFEDLTIFRPDGSNTNDYRGIELNDNAHVTFKNIKLEGCNYAIGCNSTSKVELYDNVNFKNCNLAMSCHGGETIVVYGCQGSFENCSHCWFVHAGGQIHAFEPNFTYTNNTNKTNQSVGNATNNGWITGIV